MAAPIPSVVDGWLAYCRPRLPLQNPLWAFVHNNILLEFEAQPFLRAVHEAAALYRARPFESEAFYRDELTRGRIRRECLDQVLARALPGLGERRVESFLADTSLGDVLPPAEHLRLAAHLERHAAQRHQRRLEDLLVPLVAAYLDQGLAGWPTPLREESLWDAFRETIDSAPTWGLAGLAHVRRRLAEHDCARRDVQAVIEAEASAYAPRGREAQYCLETLFALKGWSGVLWRLEREPELAPVEAPARSKLED